MKWTAKSVAVAAAVSALVVGALVFVLATRGGASGAPNIVPINTPAVVTTVPSAAVKATTPSTAKRTPKPKRQTRIFAKPSCQGDPTGSDTPSCGASDNQAGDGDSGDSSGDNQAGDSNSGDSSGDNQAGDGKAGGA